MKILHFADTHLGQSSWGKLDPQTGLPIRVRDIENALNIMVDRALEECVDVVLFAGDAFRSSDPSPTLQRSFFQPLTRLLQENIPLVMIPGNHDLPGALNRANVFEVASLFSHQRIYFLNQLAEMVTVPTCAGEMGILPLPWINRLRMIRNTDLAKLSPLEQCSEMARRLSEITYGYLENLPEGLPIILLAHQAFSQTVKVGSEKTMSWGDIPILPTSILAHPKLAYSALGHYHIHQDLIPNGPSHAVYAGSIERLDFSDEGIDKGFIIAELQGKYFLPCFHSVPAREFLTIGISLKPGDDAVVELEKALEHRIINDTILRIIIKNEGAELNGVTRQKICQMLTTAMSFDLQVENLSEGISRVRLEFERNLSPKYALEKYIKLHEEQIEPDMIDEVTAYAQRLLGNAEGLDHS